MLFPYIIYLLTQGWKIKKYRGNAYLLTILQFVILLLEYIYKYLCLTNKS